MQKVAKFKKVSYSRFVEDWKDCFPQTTDEQMQHLYEQIQLPRRATSGSAGYDFFTPISFSLAPKENIKIPTGIRVKMEEGWVLTIHPRSSLGFKYRLQIDNTTGIIDSDYYNSDNEGHIFVKLTNDTNQEKLVNIAQGEAMVQGILLPFGIVEDDDAKEVRNGGFGSTN